MPASIHHSTVRQRLPVHHLNESHRQAYIKFIEGLSPEVQRRRFGNTMQAVSDPQLSHFLNADGKYHVALAAMTEGESGTEAEGEGKQQAIIGVGRYFLLDNGEEADFSIVVADSFQRCGVATQILSRLTEYAISQGVLRFLVLYEHDNLPLKSLLVRHFGEFESRFDGGQMVAVLSLEN